MAGDLETLTQSRNYPREHPSIQASSIQEPHRWPSPSLLAFSRSRNRRCAINQTATLCCCLPNTFFRTLPFLFIQKHSVLCFCVAAIHCFAHHHRRYHAIDPFVALADDEQRQPPPLHPHTSSCSPPNAVSQFTNYPTP